MPARIAESHLDRIAPERRPMVKAFMDMERIVEAAGDRPLTQSQQRDFDSAFQTFHGEMIQTGRKTADGLAVVRYAADSGDARKITEAAYSLLSEPQSQRNDGPMTARDGLKTSRFGSGEYSGSSRGDEVRALKSNEALAADVSPSEGEDGLKMSSFVRAVVTGDWSGIDPAVKAMSYSTGSAGGYLVPELLSSRVIDKARAATRVLQAGGLTVPMSTGTVKLARVSTDPTAAWKLENASATASDMVLEQVTLTAKTLMAYLKTSVELVEDGQDIQDTIENGMANALALELDRAALRGSGTNPEPRGVRNTTGVTVNSPGGANGATPTNYNWFSTAVETVRTANYEPNAVIYSPRTAGTLDRLADTTGQPLQPPRSFEDLARYTTSQVPNNLTVGTSTDTSEAYVGQWSQLLVGVRRQLVIEASREASDTTDSAFRQLQIHIRAWLRSDVAVIQPAAFYVITGIRP